MISVVEAQAKLLALASPLPAQETPVTEAAGRYLAEAVVAKRTQPSANLSAMDGYAVRSSEWPGPWQIVGESAAGRPYANSLAAGQAVRIFTGAYIPDGADCILIQEDAQRAGNIVTAKDVTPIDAGRFVRRAGADFRSGDDVVPKGTQLRAGQLALAVAGGHGSVSVGGVPRIRIMASGDELVAPGVQCGNGQIPSSNSVMLQAMLGDLPCAIVDHGIVPDNLQALEKCFSQMAQDTDIIVTTGGVSVGDHDLVRPALHNVGAACDFWKVAMRPGKPIMAGTLGNAIVIGLPGNPASAFVTGLLFLLPLVRHLAGCTQPFPKIQEAITAIDLASVGERASFARAYVENGIITPYPEQDSGLIHPLAACNALLMQEAGCPSRPTGTLVKYLSVP
jgi:molybdopterin molybdotransferase